MERFGRGAVDIASRLVELDGEAQHLEPQAFDLLAYLLTNRDRVIAKAELLDEVWGDQFVSESALTTRIKEIRRALGDDGNRQEVIKNFRGRGYQFVAPIDGPRPAVPLATSLLGRDHDIESTTRLLDHAPLVTLIGPGGVGKTSLAREVARRRRELHADGAPIVRLAPIRDPEAVRHGLRRAIGLDEIGGTDDELIAAIADLDALLVLDNCEHLITEVARLVAAITEANGRVRILTTSRERLGLSPERVWPVDPLSDETARRLLLDRARAAQPGFELPPGSEPAVTTLLDKLDRLPLAIEMAAARLPSLGLDELLAFLDERPELLGTTDRSADDRHRTINELIGWSENLLDEEERDVLTCLSTFAGPAIAADIAAVAQRDSAELVIGSLATCVDHSLVVVDTLRQPTTYRLLEVVRARAAQRRTAGHEARHAARVIAVATEMDRVLRTPEEPAAARRLKGLEADLRIAHRWAREHDRGLAGELTAALLHYGYERMWIEPVIWAEQLLADADADADDPASLAAAAACAADCANRGDYEGAKALGERAARSGDPRVQLSGYDTLGNVGIYVGDFETTRRCLRKLDEIGEREGDVVALSFALIGEMMIRTYGGRSEAALEHLERVGPPQSPSVTSAAWIAYIEADSLAALGRDHEALDRFEQAIRLASSVGNSFVRSVAQLSALTVRSRVGDLDEARAAFVPVLTQYRRARSLTHAITALRNLVSLLVRAGEDETAMVLLGALSSPDVKVTYGVESQRLDEARATVEARVDRSLVEDWVANGAAHDPLWAVDRAIDALS